MLKAFPTHDFGTVYRCSLPRSIGVIRFSRPTSSPTSNIMMGAHATFLIIRGPTRWSGCASAAWMGNHDVPGNGLEGQAEPNTGAPTRKDGVMIS